MHSPNRRPKWTPNSGAEMLETPMFQHSERRRSRYCYDGTRSGSSSTFSLPVKVRPRLCARVWVGRMAPEHEVGEIYPRLQLCHPPKNLDVLLSDFSKQRAKNLDVLLSDFSKRRDTRFQVPFYQLAQAALGLSGVCTPYSLVFANSKEITMRASQK